MSDLHLIVADSIAQVSRSDWEALTETDVYGQFGWLQTVEASLEGGRGSQYFLLYRNDQLIAAAVAYCFSSRYDPGRPDDLLFGDMAPVASKLHLTPKMSLHFGPLIGHGRHIFWDRQCDSGEAVDRIHMLLAKISAREELSGFTFTFSRIPAEEKFLLTALRELGYLETQSWPISYLDVPWTDFDGYLRSLSRRGKNLPTKIRRESAAPERKGVRIERLKNFGSSAVEIHRLFDHTHQKNSGSSTKFGPQMIETLANVHAGKSVVSIAAADGEPTLLGCALLLTAKGTASGSLIGVAEQAINRDAFTYFNLAYYLPIRFCLDNNIHRIYFGGGLRNMKRRRGCNEMGVSIFVRPAGLFGSLFWRAWFIIHRYWVRRKTLNDAS